MSCGAWAASTAGPAVKLGAKATWPEEPKLASALCCCAVAHVAAPGSYNLGSFFATEDIVMQLW